MILSENTTLTGNGIGNLTDAVSAIVTHEINGQYELMMTYPVTGIHYSELAQNRIIWAEPDNMTAQQAFRIYRITRPLNGIVTVYARHIAYDMSGIIAEPYTASSLQTALSGLASHCVPSCPFTFTTARAVASPFKVSQPTALWSLLGGQQGSFLDVYGGEWAFDNYAATLTSHLGADRGVSVRYGKNMTELEQDLTIEATYVGIYPFWYDEETDTLVTLPEKYISTAGTGSRILILDCSGDFENQPTVAQLRTRAQSYITANNIGEPQISWKVSFAQLAQDPQYADIAALEQVQLGDTIHIFYEPMNLEASSRTVKIEYDVLMKRYRSVTLGRVKQNLATIVAGTSQEIQKAVSASRTAIDRAIENSTDFIKNGTGYMRFIYNDAGDLMEIVSLDNPDINQAQKVWRWNNGGFGFSGSGYNGPYTTAITQDGSIVADFITTGTLNAARIKAGILEDEAGKFSLNLVTGELHIEQLDVVAEKLSNIGGRNLALATGTGRSGTSSGGNLVLAKYDLSQYGQAEYLNNTTESMVISYDYEVTGGLSYGSASAELHTRIAGTIGKFGVLSLTEENRTGRRVVTSTLNTDQATSNNPDVSVRLRYAADGATITIKNLKVERGEIATDWSPAPEDLENYAVETARSQVEVSATNILAEVDQTLESYSTTTQMTAAINASAQNITSTVSETYETKADAAVVNLLPSVYYRENASGREFTVNGITWTANADGSVTAKGTATAPTTYALSGSNATDVVPWIPIEDGVSYHFSPGVDGGDWRTGYALQVQFFNASGTSLANRAFQTKAGDAVTLSGQAYAYARLTIASGYACPTDGITFYPMMERGTVGHGYVSTHNGAYAMQSQIAQNATSISSKVSKTDYNGNTIASLINQTATTTQIQASKINLTGYVTASSLTASGTTTIDGSRITTGHIDAARIKVEDLQALGATIAGWTIGTTELSKSWSGSLLTHTAGINAPATPSTSDAAFYVSATVGGVTTYPFRVNYDGKLIATSAEIEGAITSDSANITGGSINIETAIQGENKITLKDPFETLKINAEGVYLYLPNKPVSGLYDGAVAYFEGVASSSTIRSQLYLSNYSITNGTTENYCRLGSGQLSFYDTASRSVFLNAQYLRFDDSTTTGKVNINATAPSISLTDGTKTYSFGTTNGLFMYAGSSKYSALIWPDSNGAGRLVLGDGTSTKWRTELTNSGLVFRNVSDAVTAQYPAAGFSAANLKNSVSGTIPGASSKTITFRGESVALILIQSGYGIGWGSYIYNGYGVSDVRQHVTALQAGTGITFTINSAAQSVTFNNTQAADRSVNVTVVMLFGANAPTIA